MLVVSVFDLQFAPCGGATVKVVSSSQTKL